MVSLFGNSTAHVVPDDDALAGTLVSYVSASALLLCVYVFLVRNGRLSWLLEPKGPSSFHDTFKWSKLDLLSVRENEFVSRCGLDAYMSLRGIRLMAVAMGSFLLFSGIILLPAYKAQKQSARCVQWCSRHGSEEEGGGFENECVCRLSDKFSMANLSTESASLWLPTLSMIICSAVLLFLLRKEYQEVVRIRACYWLSMPPEMFTVLIDDIPDHLELHTCKGLRAHFEAMFPGKVVTVEPARFHDEQVVSQLRSIGEKRMHAYDQLQRALALRDEFGEHVPACHSLCTNSCTYSGSMSEHVHRWRNKFQELNVEFEELLSAFKLLEEDEAAGRLSRPVISCFVTFNSATAAAIATQTVLDHRFNVVAIPSPEPDDLRWDSLGFGVQRRSCSTYFARVCFAMIVIFWGVLVSVVGAMTSVDSLENQFESLRTFFEDNDWIKSLIEQAAPLILIALMAVVNPVISLLARLEARASEGDADHVATIWFFVFLVIQVFIFYGVSGSLLKTLNPILDHPSSIIDVLASNIPRNANFYIQFILTKFLTSLCFDLYRVSDIAVHAIRRCVFGASLTERDKMISRCGCGHIAFPGHRNLSSLNGNMLLLFFIATSYAVIQPLIVPTALIFFGLAYFVYAKLFMSANMQRFDSGGTLWPRTYWCYVSALLTAQLTLVGLLSLKKGLTEASLVTLLFFATWFAAALIDFRYRRLVLETPLDLASHVDKTIDTNHPGVLVPASVWRYGVLTNGEPNYFGRYMGFTSQESKILHNQISANISTAPAPSFVGSPYQQSQNNGTSLPSSDLGNNESEHVRSQEEPSSFSSTASSSSSSSLPPIPPRLMSSGSMTSDQSVSSPPASFGKRPFEYYSYRLPVACEEPLLELSPAQVFLEPSQSDEESTTVTLQEPLLQ